MERENIFLELYEKKTNENIIFITSFSFILIQEIRRINLFSKRVRNYLKKISVYDTN